MGIQRLVTFDVDLLGFPVQVRRDRNGAADFQDPGERGAVRPAELHHPGLSFPAQQPGFQAHIRGFSGAEQGEDVVLPFLGIANDALPGTSVRRGEGRGILDRLHRLQAENLDVGARRPLEMHAGRNDLRIVEDHQRVFGKKVRQLAENELVDLAALVMEQFGGVAFRQRIFCDPLVRQRIIVILDMDFRYHAHNSNFCAKLRNSARIPKSRTRCFLDQQKRAFRCLQMLTHLTSSPSYQRKPQIHS